MPDGVDAGVHAVKLPSVDSAGNLSIGQTHSEELAPPNHPMLLRRDLGQPESGMCAADCTPTVRFLLHTPMVLG
jgi:hypothetical protein